MEANSADPEQTAPIGAVLSGSTLFAMEASFLLTCYLLLLPLWVSVIVLCFGVRYFISRLVLQSS